MCTESHVKAGMENRTSLVARRTGVLRPVGETAWKLLLLLGACYFQSSTAGLSERMITFFVTLLHVQCVSKETFKNTTES